MIAFLNLYFQPLTIYAQPAYLMLSNNAIQMQNQSESQKREKKHNFNRENQQYWVNHQGNVVKEEDDTPKDNKNRLKEPYIESKTKQSVETDKVQIQSNVKNTIKKGRGYLWSSDEVENLKKYSEQYEGNLKKIYQQFPGRSHSQVRQKYRKIMKHEPQLGYQPQKRKWTEDEDDKLLAFTQKFNKQWSKIAEMFPDRDQKSVRDRFVNQLDPELKLSPWTTEEDKQLMSLYRQHGKQWTKFAEILGNRSQNQVKNRYYFYLKKRMRRRASK